MGSSKLSPLRWKLPLKVALNSYKVFNMLIFEIFIVIGFSDFMFLKF